MSDRGDNVVPHTKIRSLRDAVRKVRLADADRADVIADLHETEKARLELLSEELADVFREVPEDDDQFSFQIVPGNPPRLWIDITSHITMARDRRSYRFLKDTRLGRTVIMESASIDDVADCVTDYIAERILEKERSFEADWLLRRLRHDAVKEDGSLSTATQKESLAATMGNLLIVFLLGILIGAVGLIAYAWFANPI
ncbi:MAG: hypothetical protein ABJN26_28525 [Stappiaceae bacterium]